MDKAGIIAQIIKAEGLKGPDAEARKRSLDNKDLNELEQMLNNALSNSKTYKADGTESNFSFLGDNNWADMTGVGFDGNVWGNNIVNSENEFSKKNSMNFSHSFCITPLLKGLMKLLPTTKGWAGSISLTVLLTVLKS